MTFVFTFFIIIRRRAIIECALVVQLIQPQPRELTYVIIEYLLLQC